MPSPLFTHCPHHSCTVHVIHVLSPSFRFCPCHSHTIPVVHALSLSFMHCPCHSCTVPVIHMPSPSFTCHPPLVSPHHPHTSPLFMCLPVIQVPSPSCESACISCQEMPRMHPA